jgi:hypothetical protein
MPSYPPGTPTISGDTVSISRFLSSPAALGRRLRTFRDLRFVSDQILTGRYRLEGGAILYEQSEPFVTGRPVEKVSAGSVYPGADLPSGTAAIGAAGKWGQKVALTDEAIKRSRFPGTEVDKALQKVVNSVVKQVDSITMSAVRSAAPDTGAATSWETVATANPLSDILLAVERIEADDLGYVADTIVVGGKAYVYLMLNQAVREARKREDSDNPIYTGKIETIAGLTVLKTSTAVQPTSALVLDSAQLGGMADENALSPGYTVSDLGVEVKAIRVDEADKWDLQGRRVTVPVVQETGAVEEITGVVT